MTGILLGLGHTWHAPLPALLLWLCTAERNCSTSHCWGPWGAPLTASSSEIHRQQRLVFIANKMSIASHYLSHTLEEGAIFSKGQGLRKSKEKYSSMWHLRMLNHLYQVCHYFHPYSSGGLPFADLENSDTTDTVNTEYINSVLQNIRTPLYYVLFQSEIKSTTPLM